MPTRIDVIHTADETYTRLLKEMYYGATSKGPVIESTSLVKFQELLDKISQLAFDAGRRFAKHHPDIEI